MHSEIKKLEPIFKDNYTAIAMSSSDEYVPYLSVCLQSLIDTSLNSHNYDIIILERNIDSYSKEKLSKQLSNKNNISLRFLNPMEIISKYNLTFPPSYNLECFFRLSIPLFLNNYKKIIFTDIDLIFNEDISNLYNTELDSYPLAACQDLMFQAFLKTPNADWLNYSLNTLKLKEPERYFNTGVLLLNIEEFNNNNYSLKLLDLVSKNKYRILEQDGLNTFFQDKIKYISTAWNFPITSSAYKKIIEYMPANYYEQYKKDRTQPKIIHWAGKGKPWNNPNEDMADLWWAYARKTPYYEILLKRMLAGFSEDFSSDIKSALNYRKNILLYWKYKFLSIFKFGKQNQKYATIRANLKKEIYRGKHLRGIK